jgi:uncharacterized protein
VFAPLAALALVLGSLTLPAQPQARVNDYAHVLSQGAGAQLEQRLREEEARTSNQVVVAIFEQLEGEDIADVGYRLGQQWGLGQAGRDNGVLLLVAVKERRMRIEVGKGLEGALTDLESKIILDEVIRPAFAQGRYDEGVVRGAEAILKSIDGEFRGTGRASGAQRQRVSPIVGLGMLGLLVVLFLFFPRAGMLMLFSLGGGGGGGRGGRGGFSGGGGRFGGGGASGDW